jgi:choline dehydrogenase-like flavoprotein
VGNGQRSSSATAYLAPTYTRRPNLSVLLHARVTKIIQTGTLDGKPLFGAVYFALSDTGEPDSALYQELPVDVSPVAPTMRVKARKEVILSAGSFNSPQLLMLSGIGDRQELDAMRIPSILHLPDVGKNGDSINNLSLIILLTICSHLRV